MQYPTTVCTPCEIDSFCPLGSVTEMNQSILQLISQAYSYPNSPSSTSFDDILMANTFYIQATPHRCLWISPFFWSLIALGVAFIILIIMGVLYYSVNGMRYFHRLECVFRHSDLIGNGELWFGGLISFAMILLIIYSFLFGSMFVKKYPIETATDADFACDPSLRNTQFSSALQLLATIKSVEEAPIFKMLDEQQFMITIRFLQTGYSCNDLAAQVNR